MHYTLRNTVKWWWLCDRRINLSNVQKQTNITHCIFLQVYYGIVRFIRCFRVLLIRCNIHLDCFFSCHSPQGSFFSLFTNSFFFFVFRVWSIRFRLHFFLSSCSQTNRTRIYTRHLKRHFIKDACSRAWEMNEYVWEQEISTSSSSLLNFFFDSVLWYNIYTHTQMCYTMY
jgi:hypothetical protein